MTTKLIIALVTLSVALIAFLVAPFNANRSLAKTEFKELNFKSPNMVDKRGYINVWTLRKDVAQVEALEATDDTDHCFPEGDGDDSPVSAKESKRIDQEGMACEENIHHAFAVYQKARKSFNLAWLPVIFSAIRKGDLVAEVIMRQCETTNILDRDKIESTCDENAKRRAIAKKRLLKIGFIPAIDISDEMARVWADSPPNQKEVNQLLAMKKLRYGALGIDTDLVEHEATSELDLALMHRWRVMEAIYEDVPRAFTYPYGAQSLAINHQPITRPSITNCVTWGRGLDCSLDSSHEGPYWRAPNYNANEFESDTKTLLEEIDTHISQYLAQEPRWAVFLLHRVSHHEWVPDGMESPTHLLDRSWDGTWILDKETLDWSKPMQDNHGQAVIKRNGEYSQITVTSGKEEEPFLNVKDCSLRYSGGLTFLPKFISDDMYSYTLLGRFKTTEFIKEAVAPFDPEKRYKQVLMQCENAESHDSPRVRFLLLSGDVLVEVGGDTGTGTVSIRHYHRQP